MKKNLRQNKAITLIALVITIIVLLILAGVTIVSLTGENGLLARAQSAKENSEIAKEKDIISLAYNEAVANKTANLDTTAVKGNELNSELNNSEATARNDNPIIVTFVASKRQYKVYSNGKIEYAGIKNGEDGNIQLSFATTETESRAVLLQVSVNGAELVPLEDWLKSLSDDELKTVFLKSWYGETAQWSNVTYWNEATQSEEVCTDVRDFYTHNYSEMYNDEYEMMTKENIDWETGKPATLAYYDKLYGPEIQIGEEKIKGTVAEFIITNPGNYNVSVITKDGEYIEDTWSGYPTEKIETYSTTKAIAETGKNSQTIMAKDNKTVEVPAGFYYGTNDKVGSVSKGFVITDSVDENGYSNGNEFVWVPLDYNSSTGDILVAGTNKKMAEISSGTNYKGVLYDWEADPTGNTVASEYFEPFNSELDQNEFNTMVESLKKYGGYYVSRYSIGEENAVMTSKLATSSATKMSFTELNDLAKTYTKDSIYADMIWGSQYDALINYSLKNQTYINELGNYEGNGLNRNTDYINNVFDLCSTYTMSRENPSYMQRKATLDRNSRWSMSILTVPKNTRTSLYIKL